MIKQFTLIVSFIILAFAIVSAQSKPANESGISIKNAETIRESEHSRVPAYISFRAGQELSQEKFPEWLKNTFSLGDEFGLTPVKKELDALGYTHSKFQQTLHNIPIQDAIYILHGKEGYISSMNGVFVTDTKKPSIQLSDKDALTTALKHINAEQYKWEDAKEEAHLKWETKNENATYYPQSKLVWILDNANYDRNELSLCYMFDIYASKPLKRLRVFVDATNGKIIQERNLIHTGDVTGTAVTGYSGTQAITTDFTGSSYRLREAGRGNGIETYNMQQGTSYSSAIDFLDMDNVWNNTNLSLDEYATDAHWGTEKTYDYYLSLFNRNSLDNNGFALYSYIHYDFNYFNAFWDGYRMTYGDGDGTVTPLVCLDIVGHELTHGLTENTANLTYQGESGALNESFSDIFGNCIEKYAKPSGFSWLIGNEIGDTFRSMSNPNAYNNPDTYSGTHWISPSSTFDNGGVHINSGVQNFWFYLLSVGGTGTNDINKSYSVTGLGMNDAAAIAYRNLTTYLTPSSDFADARYYSIQSAIDLFGGCSTQVEATTNAWYAVGVGSVYTNSVVSNFSADKTVLCSAPSQVNFQNTSLNGIGYIWNFGDGNTSTAVAPSHTYTANGLYNVQLIVDGGACGKDTLLKPNYININPSNPCAEVMPDNGLSSTLNTCTGTLYDNGGLSNNYTNQTLSTVVISPPGATNITLTFSSFDFELNYDYLYIYAGPSTSSPLIGAYTGLSLPNGGTLNIPTGDVTIQQFSDQLETGSGFVMTWNCQNTLSAPIADYTIDTLYSCDKTISFTDNSIGTITTRLWDFGDGSTSSSPNPTHTYLADGVYTVSFTASNSSGGNTSSQVVNINQGYCNATNMSSVGSTTVTTCQGTLYDDGGPNNPYSSYSEGFIVIAPAGALQITLNFSSFSFEAGYDFLKIFAGSDTISPLVGKYTGTSLPNSGLITVPAGAVTIKQIIDPYVNGSGFSLTWTCSYSTSSINEINSDGIILFPNPSTGLVTIKGLDLQKTEMVSVKNILGELLHIPTLKTNTDAYQLDLKDLPDGIYFIDIVNGQSIITKKIVLHN